MFHVMSYIYIFMYKFMCKSSLLIVAELFINQSFHCLPVLSLSLSLSRERRKSWTIREYLNYLRSQIKEHLYLKLFYASCISFIF